MEVILTHSRKIRNTRLRFVFLNLSFVCQNNLRGLRLLLYSCTVSHAGKFDEKNDDRYFRDLPQEQVLSKDHSH